MTFDRKRHRQEEVQESQKEEHLPAENSPACHIDDFLREQASDKGKSLASAQAHEQRSLVALTDIGRDPDDMIAMVLGSALSTNQQIDIKAVISTLTPAARRAQLARYTLDSVGLPDVPVAVGSDLPVLKEADVHPYEFRGLPEQRTDYPNASELIKETLRSAKDASLTMLVIASFTDLSQYLTSSQEAQELLQKKVKRLVIMGGVKTENNQVVLNEKGFMTPDTSSNYEYDRDAASYALDFFQTAKIPMTFVSRYAAYAAQLSRETFDEIAETEHPLGVWLKDMNQEAFASLWERANLPPDHPARGGLPARCDRNWFIHTFCGGEEIGQGQSVWEHIKTISVYDPIATLATSPSHVEEFFIPTEVVTNDTTHTIIGVSPQETGVKNPSALQAFMKKSLVTTLQKQR
jgi:inosine-uridine nucleoside N-ribohydrolase